MDIIDRRLNPQGKNLENRQRVLVRAREAIAKAAREAITNGTLREIGHGESVTIPAKTLAEPSFHTVFTGGQREMVLPGNKEFVVGDKLKRPEGGQGQGTGEGSDSGGGEDGFRFVLSRDEFLDLFFEDLELPDLVKQELNDMDNSSPSRAGIATDGVPSQLDMGRTMRQSMARRIGLGRPKPQEVKDLEAELHRLEKDGSDPDRLIALRGELDLALRRIARVPWVDPVDLRYRRFTPAPKPAARAVMFCLMDVSGSMTQPMKELAKRFFLLLHVFLERRYKKVELVFIRHTETAEEVTEDIFFHDPRTGGTVVSTALVEMARIQKERYPSSQWNIYAAQASDGDNYSSDTARAVGLLENDILPALQHFAYIEVSTDSGSSVRRATDLWQGYEALAERSTRLAMRKASDPRDIFPVFRDLFAKKAVKA